VRLLPPDLILERIPGTTVVVDAEGRVRVRPAGGERFFPLPGLSGPGEVEAFRRLLAAVDGRRSVAEIRAALPEIEGEAVRETLSSLLGRLFRIAPGTAAETRPPVAVFGAGSLAGSTARALRHAGFRRLLALDPRRFPGCETAPFQERADRILTPPNEVRRTPWLQPQVPLERLDAVTPQALEPLLGGETPVALAVVALEGVLFQALLDVEAACRVLGIPVLALAIEGGQVTVGPLSLPGSGCLECSRARPEGGPELLPFLPVGTVEDVPPLAVQQGIARLVLEAARATAGLPDPRLLLQTLRIAGDGRGASRSFTPSPECPLCRGTGHGAEPRLPGLGTAAEVRAVVRLFEAAPKQRGQGGSRGRVGILGGGSAGYLAALALRKKLPHLRVTLIESPHIPVIGVGEASTPLLPAFLHGTLGIDMHRFFVEADPVWKLGIRFLWGAPPGAGPDHFDYPFDRGLLTESHLYEGHGNAYCPSALLMARERSHLVPLDPGGSEFAFLPAPFAYHIDNRRLVAFLEREAERAGVERLSREVVDAERREDGGIAALRTAGGERIEQDFWIDASGFRSFLLGQVLGTPFQSFASSLPTDSALAAPRPRKTGAGIRPFTVAETLDHGWCWQIALPEEDHLGYVFASAFCSPERAEAEFRRHHPGIENPRLIPFRCGRHRDAWRGNVFALGNAYGFVEPLESTALHMVLVAIDELIRHLPLDLHRDEPATRRHINARLGEQWDHLRGFLALHFRHNRRRDTPFWRHARAAEPGLGAEAEAVFRERGPLSARPCPLNFDPLWGDFGRDVLLLGQRGFGEVPAPPPAARTEREWRFILARGAALADRALPFAEARRVLQQRPHLLRRLQREAPWLRENRS
jgi:tryptophan halogenase